MISTSQKEHLTYSLILYIAILIGVAAFARLYILPWMSKISANVASAQTVIDEYNTTKDKGLSYEGIGKTLAKMKGKEELIKIIQSVPEDVKKVIVKTGNGEYLTWLTSAIATSDEDKKKLVQAKQKINSILPTMSPMSDSVDEDYITLKEYIRFIETQFLNKFELTSNVVLGIQWIQYDQDKKWSNVGSFDLRLDFKANNGNISKLIEHINISGDPKVLSESGILTEDKVPKLLSNPLMTVEALSLENVLDTTHPGDLNSGRITIRFYVRGASKQDTTFLKWAITERIETLKKEIKSASEECEKQGALCPSISKIQSFDKKFAEFTRSLAGTKSIDGTDITMMSQTVTSLRALEDEFKSLTQFQKK